MRIHKNKLNRIIEQDLEFITNYQLNWDLLRGKTILITGANGFLPAYMIETILFLNDTKFSTPAMIIGLVRSIEKANQRFSSYKHRMDLKLIESDITKPFKYKWPVHFIIHAASQASPKYFGTDPVGTLLPNCIGSYNLLNYSLNNPIEGFLFFSSGEIYGAADAEFIPINEDYNGIINSANVRSCYAESKRMGETMCVSWYHQYSIPAKIVRPFHTYGPGMALDDGRVFADFVSDIVNKRDIILTSDGKALRAFCYLSDAIIGFFTVLLNGKSGEAYNVGNPYEEYSIKELAFTLVNLFPERKLKVIEVSKPIENNYLTSNINRNCPDISKIEKLGWTPHYSVKEGFKRTIQSYELNR